MKDKRKIGSVKKRQFVLRLLIILLLSVFLGITVYMVNARRVMKNLLPMPFGVGAAVVLSGSMEPTLSVNDLVFVRRAEAYQIDDIVVYQSSHDLVIHRVVALGEGSLTTRGDANNTEDPAVPLESIKGKLVLAIPFAGLLIRGLQTLPGILIVLAAAILLMRLSWHKEKDAAAKEQEDIKAEIRLLRDQLQAKTEASPEPDEKKQEAEQAM